MSDGRLTLWEGLHTRKTLRNTVIAIIETRAWEPLGYDTLRDAWTHEAADIRVWATEVQAMLAYAMFEAGAHRDQVADAITGVGPSTAYQLPEQMLDGVRPERARTYGNHYPTGVSK